MISFLKRTLVFSLLVAALAYIAYDCVEYYEKAKKKYLSKETIKTYESFAQPQIMHELRFNHPEALEVIKEKSFKGKSNYEVIEDPEQGPVLHASSSGSSSMLYDPIHVDMEERPTLSWTWKAKDFPTGKSHEVLGSKNENDFAARVYAMFKGATILTSDVIQYVIDDHFEEGTKAQSPYSNRVKILVVENGLNGWSKEKRDLVKDYMLLFGKEPKKPLSAVGFMSDSDDTQSTSAAMLKHITVSRNP